jgi:hypothetical protein
LHPQQTTKILAMGSDCKPGLASCVEDWVENRSCFGDFGDDEGRCGRLMRASLRYAPPDGDRGLLPSDLGEGKEVGGGLINSRVSGF